MNVDEDSSSRELSTSGRLEKAIRFLEEIPELLECYDTRGRSMLRAGTVIGKNYHLVKVLGYGAFSAAWLSWDQSIEKFVVIKVYNSSEYRFNAFNELQLLPKIHKCDPTDRNRDKVIGIVRMFKLRTECDLHTCAVLNSVGISLSDLMIKSPKGFTIPQAKSIIRQILEGIDYVHSKCKIIHTDIKPENIIICVGDAHLRELLDKATELYFRSIKIPAMAGLSTEKRQMEGKKNEDVMFDKQLNVMEEKCLEESNIELDISNQPHSSKESTSYCTLKEWEHDMNIKIIDFGNACKIHSPTSDKIQTRQYRCFEVLIGALYGSSADIWSIGCIAFEVVTGTILFDPPNLPGIDTNEVHIYHIMKILGEIPEEIRNSGVLSRKYFGPSGNLIHFTFSKKKDIGKKRLINILKWDPAEAHLFTDFLFSMVKYDPSKRATASECLQHPWLNN